MKKRKAEEDTPEPVSRLDLERFPEVPMAHRPRELFFDKGLERLETETLRARGYEPVHVFTLPRRNDAEQSTYLLAVAQGLEEGTIFKGEDAQEALWREMQSYGLFARRQGRMNLNVNVSSNDLATLLGWNKSRHTLRDNSTVVGISQVNSKVLEDKQKEVMVEMEKAFESKKARKKK